MAIDLHRRDCPLSGDCESLEVAERQLLLMEKYLQRFLSLGKPGPARHQPVEVGRIVADVVSLMRPSAKHAGVALDWHPPDVPLLVRGDPERLEQLVVNLLLNAIEAAAVPGSTPRLSPEPQVVVRLLRTSGDQLALHFEDTGPGLDTEAAQHLFEPFATNKASGAGIGLCVAREIAREHGGDMEWCRREAVTCFTTRLPLSHQEASSCPSC